MNTPTKMNNTDFLRRNEEFAARSKQYQERAKALDAAIEKSRGINALHTMWTALTVVVGLVILWLNPSIHWGIAIVVALVIIRWIGNMVVHFRFTAPEMARINREFPAPEPRKDE